MARPRTDHQLLLDESFDDLDAVRERIGGWDLDLLQLERGAFRGRVRQWRSGTLFFARAHFARRLSQRGAPPGGALTFAVPASDDFEVRWRGQPARSNDIMVFPADGGLDVVSSSAFDVFTISLPVPDWARLENEAGALAELTAEQVGRVCRCSPDSMGVLRQALRRAEATAIGQDANDEATIPTLALEAVRTAVAPSAAVQIGSDRRRALLGAVAYFDAKLRRSIRIADVCRSAGVSERTLQYAFQAEFGLTPMQYLHARRLQRVRRELVRASTRRGIIDGIARAHGLRHGGRFADDYRAMFGERPSETLRRKTLGRKNVTEECAGG